MSYMMFAQLPFGHERGGEKKREKKSPPQGINNLCFLNHPAWFVSVFLEVKYERGGSEYLILCGFISFWGVILDCFDVHEGGICLISKTGEGNPPLLIMDSHSVGESTTCLVSLGVSRGVSAYIYCFPGLYRLSQ